MDRTHSATTIRQPAYAELLIDSFDRFPNGFPVTNTPLQSSSSWRTNLGNYPLNGYFTRLAITQVQFQWNLPTIITGYNDKFIVTVTTGVDAGVQTLTLDQGYYTPTELAAEIQSKLQAAFPASVFTCVFLEGSFVINSDEDFLLPDVGQGHIFQRCLLTCGFLKTGGVAADVYVGTVPSLLPTRYIDILSSYITKFQDVKDSSTNDGIIYVSKIARIYPCPPSNRIDISPSGGPSANPFYITIDYATPKMIMWNPDEALANFDLQLRDEFGDFVPWAVDGVDGYGCEYLITMLASET
jgi:hypothetical protein